jgi:hypothetical protein
MNQWIFADPTVTPQPLRELLDLTGVVANGLIGQSLIPATTRKRSQFSQCKLNRGDVQVTDLRRTRHLDQS